MQSWNMLSSAAENYLLHVVCQSFILIQKVLLQGRYVFDNGLRSGKACGLQEISRHDVAIMLRVLHVDVWRIECFIVGISTLCNLRAHVTPRRLSSGRLSFGSGLLTHTPNLLPLYNSQPLPARTHPQTVVPVCLSVQGRYLRFPYGCAF
jgi:hypothetical protein